jgi:hypothetical protein
MPTHTLPEVQTETADDKPVWALQDRIEAGTHARGDDGRLASLSATAAQRWRTGNTSGSS